MGKFKIILPLLASSALASPALAQSASGPPPLHSNVDENGVDLVTGKFIFSMTEGVIGSGKGAVSLERIWSDGAWKDNWSGGLYLATDGNYYVDFGDISDSFSVSGTTYTPRKANGASLINGGLSDYTYTAPDGTQVGFMLNGGAYPLQGYSCPNGTQPNACAIPVLIVRPDGTRFAIDWDIVDGNAAQLSFFRFRGVGSSAGYGFTINYATNFPGNLNNLGAPRSDWYKKTGVAFTNSAVACTGECPSVTYGAPSGLVTTITDALTRQWQLTLNSTGKLAGIRRPGEASDSTTITYNVSGFVTSVVHDGVTTTYSRSFTGNTSTMVVTDPLSHSKTVTGDIAKDRVTAFQDELGRTTSYQYDANARPTRITLPLGNYFQFTYDGRGNVTEQRAVSKTPGTPPDIVATAAYPSTCTNPKTCNQPTSTTDPKLNVTDYAYDANSGGVATIALPAPVTAGVRPQTRYTYAQVTSASGGLVYMLTGTSACQTTSSCLGAADETKATSTYNSNLLPITVSRGSGTTTLATDSFTYDPAGNLLTHDGPLSGTSDTTRYRYDADRETVGVVSPDPDGAGALKNRAIRLTYRADGQVSKQEIGTVNSQSDPDWALFAPLQTVDVTFDSNARPISSKLSAGGTNYALTQTSYDSLGRVDCVAQRMNIAVYGSLPASACTLSTQGGFGPDRISQLVYDNAGEVTQVKVAVGVTGETAIERTLTYTNNGFLATLKDAENNLTTYVYDGFDRLLQTQFPSSAKGAGTSDPGNYEQLTYDPNSNVVSRRLRDTTSIALTYDNLDRVTLKDLPGSEPNVIYGYDNLGRLTSAAQTGNNLSLTYDALSRNLTQIGPLGTISSAWDPAGRKTRLTYSDGFFVDYDYLTTGELTKVRENGASSGVGVLATFVYDNLGNRTSLTFGNSVIESYGYDLVSRLTSLAHDEVGTTYDQSLTFSYNPASQIVTRTASNDAYAFLPSNENTTGTANGLNQLTNVGAKSLAHDMRGNVTGIGTDTFGYSSENLLSSGTVGGAAANLTYDPLLRLYQITSTSPYITQFSYDGQDIVGEYYSGALVGRHVFDPTTGQPLVTYLSGGTTDRVFLSPDERGSVMANTNNSGSLIYGNPYDEFGNRMPWDQYRFQYTGQAWLPELGLNYYKARMYSPALGRFMQTDPIGYEDSPNLYAYVFNDPINQLDPLGLCIGGGGSASGNLSSSEITITCPRISFDFTILPYGISAIGPVLPAFENIVSSFLIPTAVAPQQQCPAGPRTTVGIGASLTGFLKNKGVSAGASLNVAIPSSFLASGSLRGSQFFISVNITGLRGGGLFGAGGYSAVVGASPGALRTGTSINRTYQGGAALGTGGEISAARQQSRPDFSASFGPRYGGGAYAAKGTQYAGVIAFPQIGCHR